MNMKVDLSESERMLTDRSLRNALEAALLCRYKAYLKLQGEQGLKSNYELLHDELRESAKRKAAEAIMASNETEAILAQAPLNVAALKLGKRFILDATIETDYGLLHIDGLRRESGPSKLGSFHYTPLLIQEGYQVGKTQRTLLEALSHVLVPLQGQVPKRAVVYCGDNSHLTTVQLSPDLRQGRILLNDFRSNHLPTSVPLFTLNEHCGICEFQERCYNQALAEDNLSLLRGIGPKELKAYAKEGIFTVTQLAHTFGPRRKGKRPQQRTPHYHALQAMCGARTSPARLGKHLLRIARKIAKHLADALGIDAPSLPG